MLTEPFSVDYVLALHAAIMESTGGSRGVRDRGLLESALAQPFQGFGDRDFYPTVPEKAAAQFYGVIENHPFADGNKRTACALMLVMLRMADLALDAPDDDLYAFVIAAASGGMSLDDVNAWLSPRIAGR